MNIHYMWAYVIGVAMETAGDIGLVDGGVVVLIGADVINEALGAWIPVAELDIGIVWWLGRNIGTAVLDFGAAKTEAAAAAPVKIIRYIRTRHWYNSGLLCISHYQWKCSDVCVNKALLNIMLFLVTKNLNIIACL